MKRKLLTLTAWLFHFRSFLICLSQQLKDEAKRVNRRIVILGFMGCGKTTIARELARQLEAEPVDLDSFVTDHEGRSPAEIIAAEGESAFRELETAALNEVLTTNAGQVIALGGGTWTVPANRTLIALHDCTTIWLDRSVRTLLAKNQRQRQRHRSSTGAGSRNRARQISNAPRRLRFGRTPDCHF